MKKGIVGIVDYGVGNHASVVSALKNIGYRSFVSDDPRRFESADLVLLPGVGAFPSAMKSLCEKGLDCMLIEKWKQGNPILGLCLGMQLFATTSEEVELTNGLNLLPGNVIRTVNTLPNIGWNSLEISNEREDIAFADNWHMYFNHQFELITESQHVAAVTRVAESGNDITAAIWNDNLCGLQFHPEKSQRNGSIFFEKVMTELLNA